MSGLGDAGSLEDTGVIKKEGVRRGSSLTGLGDGALQEEIQIPGYVQRAVLMSFL